MEINTLFYWIFGAVDNFCQTAQPGNILMLESGEKESGERQLCQWFKGRRIQEQGAHTNIRAQGATGNLSPTSTYMSASSNCSKSAILFQRQLYAVKLAKF